MADRPPPALTIGSASVAGPGVSAPRVVAVTAQRKDSWALGRTGSFSPTPVSDYPVPHRQATPTVTKADLAS